MQITLPSRQGLFLFREGVFLDMANRINEIKRHAIRVLSLPSYHPYNKRFDNQGEIAFVNPDCDFFSNKEFCSSKYLDENFPVTAYDVVHIHFEYYLTSSDVLKSLLQYFRKNKKPVVWTCHDRSSLLDEATGCEHEALLSKRVDAITTLTRGCAQFISSRFQLDKDKIKVIPHGYIAHPAVVAREAKKFKKNENIFTIHVGDFRKNKEFVFSIRDFLSCPQLNDAKLQVIFRPINIYHDDDDDEIKRQRDVFCDLIKHPRVIVISNPYISDDLLIRAFLVSHAIILPYKWGTHSGQLELARDCGCHVVSSNVGFYKEQWEQVVEWDIYDNKKNWQTGQYQQALVKAYRRDSLQPAGFWRKNEFEEIIKDHMKIYNKLIHA